jgi:tRNA pseudouridine38-40 synthase
MRYFFHIGYDGFNYHGWQKHAPHLTIQQVLEDCISRVLRTPTTIYGCGRTDARVHASQYFFHLDSGKELCHSNYQDDLVFRLNKLLPHDITVFDVIKADNKSHAQYSATKRTYSYFIHTYKDPFLNRFSTFHQHSNLPLDKIKLGLALLTKHNDYKAFCKSPGKYEHTICNVSSAKLFSDKKRDMLQIEISSNRFLRGMIRAIVAKLLQIGTQISIDEFQNLLVSKQPGTNIKFAAPQGLYLSKIVYPFLDLSPRTTFAPFFHHAAEFKCEFD